MSEAMVLNIQEFELPEDAKITKVFDRLMRINAAAARDDLHEVYYERHDRYEESYGIGLF